VPRANLILEKDKLGLSDNDYVVKQEWPWDVVKEIARQNRRFTYLEIHRY
jgi:hypothetical protein